jgi:hypothetical protein
MTLLLLLQIKELMKSSPGRQSARVGQKLQLLFIKPPEQPVAAAANSGRRPELRSLPSARSYLEACIYQLDLKAGKRYHLFLAAQPGQLTGRADLARYVMTGPPLLASKKSAKKILAATCKDCGKCLLQCCKCIIPPPERIVVSACYSAVSVHST